MALKHSARLGEATKRVLNDRRWTLRQAERNTGIGYGTIQNMTEGKAPSAEIIAKWALAVGEGRSYWLRIAGYEILTDDDSTVNDEAFSRAGFHDDGERWRNLTDEERENFRRLMDSILAGRGDPRDQM